MYMHIDNLLFLSEVPGVSGALVLLGVSGVLVLLGDLIGDGTGPNFFGVGNLIGVLVGDA